MSVIKRVSRYDMEELITSAKLVKVNSYAVAFKNQGDTTVILNNTMKIYPKSSYFFGDNTDTVINDLFDIEFEGTGINELLVIREHISKEVITSYKIYESINRTSPEVNGN